MKISDVQKTIKFKRIFVTKEDLTKDNVENITETIFDTFVNEYDLCNSDYSTINEFSVEVALELRYKMVITRIEDEDLTVVKITNEETHVFPKKYELHSTSTSLKSVIRENIEKVAH